MAIIGGLDVHRRQITFDDLDGDTGELVRGRGGAGGSGNAEGLAGPVRWAAGGVRGGGLHRVAVRG